jgi:hypothetical protein
MTSRRISDTLSLRKERAENAIPFSLTPFVDPRELGGTLEVSTEKGSCDIHHYAHPFQEPGVDELRVKAPAEVPWIGDYLTG